MKILSVDDKAENLYMIEALLRGVADRGLGDRDLAAVADR